MRHISAIILNLLVSCPSDAKMLSMDSILSHHMPDCGAKMRKANTFFKSNSKLKFYFHNINFYKIINMSELDIMMKSYGAVIGNRYCDVLH